jgi:hypothetical protein
MSKVRMALYNPLVMAGVPMAFRMYLLRSTSRITIMEVRRRLSPREIAKYGYLKLVATELQPLVVDSEA